MVTWPVIPRLTIFVVRLVKSSRGRPQFAVLDGTKLLNPMGVQFGSLKSWYRVDVTDLMHHSSPDDVMR